MKYRSQSSQSGRSSRLKNRIKEDDKISDAGKLRVEKFTYSLKKAADWVKNVEIVFLHSHLMFAKYKAIVVDAKEGELTVNWTPQYRGNYL